MGLFWQQMAGLGHDLGHTNVSKRFDSDHWVGSVVGATLSGLSTAWWKRNHNTHHVVPNSVENDPDIQHMPLMAVSKHVIEKPYYSTYYDRHVVMDRAAQFMVGNQHLLFFPLMAVARFNLYAQGLIMLCNPKSVTKFRYHELISIAVFFTWVGALVLQLPTWFDTVACVLVAHAAAGVLHIQIVISHWAMETYTNKSSQEKKKKEQDNLSSKDVDWYTLQLRTTMDINCPTYMDWFHFGLQFQVEHHLFPTLPRPSLRIARQMVEQVCQKHGLPYHAEGFWESVSTTCECLRETAALARSGKYTKNMLAEAWNAEG